MYRFTHIYNTVHIHIYTGWIVTTCTGKTMRNFEKKKHSIFLKNEGLFHCQNSEIFAHFNNENSYFEKKFPKIFSSVDNRTPLNQPNHPEHSNNWPHHIYFGPPSYDTSHKI